MIHWNLSPKELIEKTLSLGQGTLAENGALCVDTGEFTGRSPKDRFVVCDEITEEKVFWGDVNFKITPENFEKIYSRLTKYLEDKELYARDAFVCADKAHQVHVQITTELPWQNLFVHDLFIRPTEEELKGIGAPAWTIISAPGFFADPKEEGTRQKNFTILNFSKKLILIGGTGYTGEIKKGMFSALQFLLPTEKNVLSMHCSANIGASGDTAIFFGLSGTGKTTLSADPKRKLIGDDEHGWGETIFNFEGGCYAKCVNLTEEKEPQIWNAIKEGALVENTNFFSGTHKIDFDDISKTENTRVAYPIEFIKDAVIPSVGGTPKNIFFLTCDACGILPPISKLTPEQAMYYFISGYTAKVAGTEVGIKEPQLTFSACFGKAFLPLHPLKYAEMLGERLKKNPDVNVWLVNTGWSGGAYGIGKRMSLKHTRALIDAALDGSLEKAEFEKTPMFNLSVPKSCPDVPSEILMPRNTWTDKIVYDSKAHDLAKAFIKNFEQYQAKASAEIVSAGPQL